MRHSLLPQRLLLGLALLPCLPARAQQTNLPPVNPLQNMLGDLSQLDTNNTVFASEKLELRLGALSQGVTGSAFNSLLAGSYNLQTHFSLAGEVINSAVGNGVESTHAFLELRQPLGNFSLSAFMGPGWNFSHGTLEGSAGLRVCYLPSPGHARVFTFVESRLRVDAKSLQAPTSELVAGVGYPF